MLKTIAKPWGKEELLVINKNYVIKRITMYADHKCSLQYHMNKLETIILERGLMILYLGDINLDLTSDSQPITIAPGQAHRMKAVTDISYLEISTTELDDVVRIEDEYGRA